MAGRPPKHEKVNRICQRDGCDNDFETKVTIDGDVVIGFARDYCSRSCARTVDGAKKRERYQAEYEANPKLCECGGPIPYEHRHRWLYCSPECRKLYGKKRPADPDNWVTLVCCNENCPLPGGEFERRKCVPNSNPDGNVFCSNECAQKWTRTIEHIGVDGVVLDSGWEALVWGWARFCKYPIERVDRSLSVKVVDGHYAPDFRLDLCDGAGWRWVEVKGLEDVDDPQKWSLWTEQHGAVEVWDRDTLEELLASVVKS